MRILKSTGRILNETGKLVVKSPKTDMEKYQNIFELWYNTVRDFTGTATELFRENYRRSVLGATRSLGSLMDIAEQLSQNDLDRLGVSDKINYMATSRKAEYNGIKQELMLNGYEEGSGAYNDEMDKRLRIQVYRMWDDLHRVSLMGTQEGLKARGLAKYTFVCENEESSCDRCMALHGLVFDLKDAKEGVNFPPIHPNCRCSINLDWNEWVRVVDREREQRRRENLSLYELAEEEKLWEIQENLRERASIRKPNANFPVRDRKFVPYIYCDGNDKIVYGSKETEGRDHYHDVSSGGGGVDVLAPIGYPTIRNN